MTGSSYALSAVTDDVSTDLIKEVWQFGDVIDIIRCQFNRDDFKRVGGETRCRAWAPQTFPKVRSIPFTTKMLELPAMDRFRHSVPWFTLR